MVNVASDIMWSKKKKNRDKKNKTNTLSDAKYKIIK